ncbi:MAG: hypothetical protein RR804_17475 [Massilia sp.]
MHPATASTRRAGHARSNRRLVGGIAISLLLHALLLSLQFGVPGSGAGGGGPLSVVLAPAALPRCFADANSPNTCPATACAARRRCPASAGACAWFASGRFATPTAATPGCADCSGAEATCASVGANCAQACSARRGNARDCH